MKKAVLVGISFALSQGAIYMCFAAGFYFGATLIVNDELDFQAVFM